MKELLFVLPRLNEINLSTTKEDKMYRVEIKFGDTFIMIDKFESLDDALCVCRHKSIQWRIRRNGWTMARSI